MQKPRCQRFLLQCKKSMDLIQWWRTNDNNCDFGGMNPVTLQSQLNESSKRLCNILLKSFSKLFHGLRQNDIISTTIFQNYRNHQIKFTTITELLNNFRLAVSDKHLNAIFSDEDTFNSIREHIYNTFPNSNFIFYNDKSGKCNRFN